MAAGGATNPRKRKWTAEMVVAGLRAFYGPAEEMRDRPPPPSLEASTRP